MAYQFFPGATAVGISFNNGVLLASERRVSFGNFVVNKSTKKTFVLTENVGAACAGMVADMNVLARQVAALSKIRKFETRRDLQTNSVAKLMSVMVTDRQNLQSNSSVSSIHLIPSLVLGEITGVALTNTSFPEAQIAIPIVTSLKSNN